MSAYKLQITEPKLGINANVRYGNMSKLKKPEIVAKNSKGDVVKERTTYQGQVLGPGSTQRQWVDDNGTIYGKSELTFWYGEDQVNEISQTKVFEIQGYQPEKNYTDNYVIASYYEVWADDNGMKKDIDREIATRSNNYQLRKLWEHLRDTKQVARGEFCVSSKGFVASDGYIRAVEFGNKWGIEIGVFKEEKVFEHLKEDVPEPTQAPAQAARGKRLKMV